MLDCVLISSDEGFRHSVLGIVQNPKNQTTLALDLQVYADGLTRETLSKVLLANPSIIFLDLGPDPEGVGQVQTLNQQAPDVALVVGGPALSAEGLLAVMRAGASEYLPRPFSQKEVSEAFERVRRRSKSAGGSKSVRKGKVTTVFSAKGGTGVTTVATNLAVALRMLTEKEVLLLDLAPSLGTAAVAMGVQPRYSFADVIRNFHRIDEELFRSFLETDDSGVDVLAAPFMPAGTEVPTDEELHALIHLCREQFDYIVVDAGSFLSSQLGSVLRNSDERVIVLTPELPALRNLRKALDLHGQTNGKGPPQLVLNQYQDGSGLSTRDVEDGLGRRMALVLEKDDARVIESQNIGRPEVQRGKSKFSKKILELGRQLAGSDVKVQPRKGIWSRLFKSRSRPSDAEAAEEGQETK